VPGETKFRDEAFGKLSSWIFRKDRGCSGALPRRRVRIPQALRLVLLEIIISRQGVYRRGCRLRHGWHPYFIALRQGKNKKI
jgi:hypothetical protein